MLQFTTARGRFRLSRIGRSRATHPENVVSFARSIILSVNSQQVLLILSRCGGAADHLLWGLKF